MNVPCSVMGRSFEVQPGHLRKDHRVLQPAAHCMLAQWEVLLCARGDLTRAQNGTSRQRTQI